MEICTTHPLKKIQGRKCEIGRIIVPLSLFLDLIISDGNARGVSPCVRGLPSGRTISEGYHNRGLRISEYSYHQKLGSLLKQQKYFLSHNHVVYEPKIKGSARLIPLEGYHRELVPYFYLDFSWFTGNLWHSLTYQIIPISGCFFIWWSSSCVWCLCPNVPF